jgi:hypothetical protein
MAMTPMQRRHWIGAGLVMLISSGFIAPFVIKPSPPIGQRFTGIAGTTLSFGGEGALAPLLADDDWLKATSDIQRNAIWGGVSGTMEREAFREWQGSTVEVWSKKQRARWWRTMERIAPKLNTLQLPWPQEIFLLQTSGSASADQPHTRGRTIVMPVQFEQQDFSDDEVLAHELWHVLSRHRPELATRLYALIGYRPCGELQWPAEWVPLRIANPDAPYHRHAMTVAREGRSVALMPVVVSEKAQPGPADRLFELMETRVLEVIPGENGAPTLPVMRDGEPVWHAPEALTEFTAALGGNSDYVSHPEETIADNFMFLISGRKVPNPGLIERIGNALRG